MISLEETNHIAELARIEFSNEELKQLQTELSLILGYIDTLKEVDIKDVKPMSHSALIKNVFRKDEAVLSLEEKKESKIKNLLDCASKKDKGFIKVKSVFKK